ncbi:sulfurtransferase complex subunit TusC [Buchnera aphidicola (Chaitoregma tattakana)]|uniref:sulfurtransferase complex subunit TusC n=1 Tax=Buchnera aphidicola TaxID=9 RepID=UPI0031B84087
MKNVAFLFCRSPYGKIDSKEMLDLYMSISLAIKQTGVFFLGDGVFQILDKQHPEKIFLHNFFKSFSSLLRSQNSSLYLCKDSLKDRGIKFNQKFLVNVNILTNKFFRKKLNLFDLIINF